MKAPHPFIADGIREIAFTSPYDSTQQTFLLKDYREGKTEEAPPLVIYLHGSHSHQEQGMTAGIYNDAFSRLGQLLRARQAIYVCPEYRGNSWMGPAAEADVHAIIRCMKAEYRPRYTLLIGGSMGGTSALIYTMLHPEEIDGVLAFCPATDPAEVYERDIRFQADLAASYGGSPEETPGEYRRRTTRHAAQVLAGTPLVIFHGAEDNSIPVQHSDLLVHALKKLRAPVIYHRIPHGGHDTPLDLPLDAVLAHLIDDEPYPEPSLIP